MLWSRFQQCLGTFTILLVEVSSETGLFTALSEEVFGVRNFGKTKSVTVIFFVSKCLKFTLDLKNAAKTWQNVFYFSHNSMSIGIVKLSLLRTGYFSSSGNGLASSPKVFMSIRETFSNSIALAVINEHDKGAVMQISTVFGHIYHIACQSILWNWTF